MKATRIKDDKDKRCSDVQIRIRICTMCYYFEMKILKILSLASLKYTVHFHFI
jgi:hypothetical protein